MLTHAVSLTVLSRQDIISVLLAQDVVKATETAVGTDGMIKEYDGWTNEFIFPPYNFGFADSMLVNFYHPYSTLLMETAASEVMIL